MITSPNSVLANALLRVVDLVRPALARRAYRGIELVVGTQINGRPHLGTALVQCFSFMLAAEMRRSFSVDAAVRFSALDNAPYEVREGPEAFNPYQKPYYHALGRDGVAELIEDYYVGYFEALAELTGSEYEIETYTQQQASAPFRQEFLRSLSHYDDLRWCVAPSTGVSHVRVPCPLCGWAEKRADRTRIVNCTDHSATFEAFCLDHDEYEVEVGDSGSAYVDLNTLYRNVVKEAVCMRDDGILHVMVKGGDWAMGVQPVDWAHGVLGRRAHEVPIRLFCPQILASTGAKFSKSLLRESAIDPGDWTLDITKFPGGVDALADRMVWCGERLLGDPKHFLRSYCRDEFMKIMANHTPSALPRARPMRIYRKYFDMIASGEKTIEIRVAYSSLARLRPGSLLRFESGPGQQCLTRVKRIARYADFPQLLAAEDVRQINPHASKEQQLEDLRRIFPPEKEKLGAVAIEIERVEPA